jgi:release factor glutamine methyltransferase
MNGLLHGNRIADLSNYIKQTLTNEGFEDRETLQMSKWLLEDLLQKPYVEILINLQQHVSESEILRLHFKLKRIVAKEPIQYVLGYSWFMGKRFEVNPSVLIPRPETEELVSQIIQCIKHRKNGRLIDLGTGSGCIPIVIKDKLPNWQISAVDISDDALIVAERNANTHLVQVDFYRDDILNMSNVLGVFDVIVSNPPYVLMSDQTQMQKHVLDHEPHLALFVPDSDPCLFYRRIVEWADDHLSAQGLIAFEVHEKYASFVAEILANDGFDVEIVKDLQDKDRFVFGTR